MKILHNTFQYKGLDELFEGNIKLFDCKILKDFGNFKAGETYQYLDIYYDDQLVIAYKYNELGDEIVLQQTKFKLTPI